MSDDGYQEVVMPGAFRPASGLPLYFGADGSTGERIGTASVDAEGRITFRLDAPLLDNAD